jgi:hypothetical protein
MLVEKNQQNVVEIFIIDVAVNQILHIIDLWDLSAFDKIRVLKAVINKLAKET